MRTIMGSEPSENEDFDGLVEHEPQHVDVEEPEATASDPPQHGSGSSDGRARTAVVLGIVSIVQLVWVVLVVLSVWWLFNRVG
jgi:hypothetical protein